MGLKRLQVRLRGPLGFTLCSRDNFLYFGCAWTHVSVCLGESKLRVVTALGDPVKSRDCCEPPLTPVAPVS